LAQLEHEPLVALFPAVAGRQEGHVLSGHHVVGHEWLVDPPQRTPQRLRYHERVEVPYPRSLLLGDNSQNARFRLRQCAFAAATRKQACGAQSAPTPRRTRTHACLPVTQVPTETGGISA